MKYYKHNSKTWGITLDYFNEVGTDPILWGKKNGNFVESLPQAIKKYFPDPTAANYNEVVENLFNNKVNEIIGSISRPIKILSSFTNFSWLLPFTIDLLRSAVCKQLQHSIENQWSEITQGNSYSTNNLTFSRTITNWKVAYEKICTDAWSDIIASQITKYDWVQESYLYTKTKNGNIYVIGSTDNIGEKVGSL